MWKGGIMKIVKMLICIMMLMQVGGKNVFANGGIKVKVNERTVAMDTDPYISGNHTLVPIRFVAAALDCEEIIWNEEKRAVTIKDNGTEILLTINSEWAYVNGEKVPLNTVARIKNNRTYIPVRFVAENMGAAVWWDEGNKIVNISKEGITPNIPYNEDELFWLARIIHAEAQGEPFVGKVAVGNVVLNRVKAAEFPNSIYGVIFDRNNGIQFTPVANGTIYNNPSNDCFYAADRALRGDNTAGSSLFFCNPVTSSNTWIMNNRVFYSAIGKHYFYL